MEALVSSLGCEGGGGGYGRSVPLTTPDLHLLLDRLQVQTEETKDRVFTTVKARYKDLVDLVDRATTASSNVDTVNSQLHALLHDGAAFGTAGLSSFDSRLWKLSAEVKSMRGELQLKSSALSLLKSVSALRDELLTGKENFYQGRLVEGVRKIAGVDRVLEESPNCTLRMFVLLKQLGLDVFHEVESTLSSLFSQAVSVDLADGTLTVAGVKFSGAKVDPRMILEAMEELGLLDEALNRFTDAACKLLSVLIRETFLLITVEEGDGAAVFRISNPEAHEPRRELSVEAVYDRVLYFVKFLRKHVANSHVAWMGSLGMKIWPRLADMIIQTHLRKAIPKDHTQFGDFEKIQTLTGEFENALQTENFISLNDQGNRLSYFTADVEVHFSSEKRKKVLANARNIIIQFSYAQLLKSLARNDAEGEHLLNDGLSNLPIQLLSLVHEILKNACSSTSRIALELYKGARDVMFLFRAIFLLQYDSATLQAAAIFYNDCLYIAGELANISKQYNSLLPLDLQHSCTFMDLVPLFKFLSTKMLSEQVKSVSDQLMQMVDEANGFKSTDDRVQRETTESALHQIVSLLQTIHVTWHEFLPKAVEARGLLNLVEPIAQRIIYEVLAIQDLAAEETVQLHNLLEELLQGLVPVLKCVERHYRRPLDKILPAWRKLKCLSELLEMSLRPITQAWESGSLTSAGFTSAEIQKLIEAIFTDTSLRAECLLRISS